MRNPFEAPLGDTDHVDRGHALRDLAAGVTAQQLILAPHHILAVASFQAADGEVSARDRLEMIDERVVHGGAPRNSQFYQQTSSAYLQLTR